MVFTQVVDNNVRVIQKFESPNLDHPMKSYDQITEALLFWSKIGIPHTI